MPLSTPQRPLFFDQKRFVADLQKKPAVKVFKDAINAANHQFDERFKVRENIRTLIRERAAFIDVLLQQAWQRSSWPAEIALVAVGGYGRGELHPHSDIDLLILLHDEEQGIRYREDIENFITFLWDISLSVGQSVRTIDECVVQAQKDITIATALMECRLLCGSQGLLGAMMEATGPDKIWPADAFFQAKWAEQIARHQEYNDTEYNLEPNVKNAPGGLRDIQMIGWATKRHFRVRSLSELHGKKDFFNEEEYATLLSSEDFLWRVRYGLHMLAGRAEERLLFDHQRELAREFGYRDNEQGLAVEQFMKHYYRAVLAISELNDVLLHYLDEHILRSNHDSPPEIINERFQSIDDYLACRAEDTFVRHPSALLEIFVILGNRPQLKGMHARTIRQLRSARFLIDDEFRHNPVNQRLFMELMNCSHQLSVQLRRMKRYGILSRYLPEFGDVIGQMQHDLFHIYTVDAHTLQVIENMRKLRHPETSKLFPTAAAAFKRLHNPSLLYIAGLYHDIGKGRGGDHSKLGAVDARRFCQRHDLNNRDTKLVGWLVEKHLLMSTVAQKQDISDPEVLHRFAQQVGDESYLHYLFCLTVADINGTNPTLWNNWRASLFNQLYDETLRLLRRGLEKPVNPQEWVEDTQQDALKILGREGFDPQDITRLWEDMGQDYFLREHSGEIAWHTSNILRQPQRDPLILIRTSGADEEATTQIFIRTLDRDNIFAATASALGSLNLNILDARLYSASSGHTVDTFFVLDQNGKPLPEDSRTQQHVISVLEKELELAADYSDVVRRRTPRQLKHFAYPTRCFLTHNSEYSMLEVISPDRPGLLACIGRIFTEKGIDLLNAKITTLGERVEDVFFITTEKGGPLDDPALCHSLQQAICDALDSRNQASEQAPITQQDN